LNFRIPQGTPRLLSVFCRSSVCLSHLSALSKPNKLVSWQNREMVILA